MNLVKRTGQRLTQVFTQFDRRLKSLDKKEMSSEVIGQEGGDDIHHKRRGDNRPPDSQTTSTDKVSMEQRLYHILIVNMSQSELKYVQYLHHSISDHCHSLILPPSTYNVTHFTSFVYVMNVVLVWYIWYNMWWCLCTVRCVFWLGTRSEDCPRKAHSPVTWWGQSGWEEQRCRSCELTSVVVSGGFMHICTI